MLMMMGACRKDQLKKNPVMGNDELNSISGGLGDEAAQEGSGDSKGEGGLADMGKGLMSGLKG